MSNIINEVSTQDSKARLYKKLLAIQCELKAPKNQYNSFGNYHYRSSEDILEAVKPLCQKHNAILLLNDSIETIENARPVINGQTVVTTNAFYIKSTVTFIDSESGESCSVSAVALHALNKKGMDESQISGATSSYARKYALNGMFCIDDSKDADALPNQPAKKAVSNTQTYPKGNAAYPTNNYGTAQPSVQPQVQPQMQPQMQAGAKPWLKK